MKCGGYVTKCMVLIKKYSLPFGYYSVVLARRTYELWVLYDIWVFALHAHCNLIVDIPEELHDGDLAVAVIVGLATEPLDKCVAKHGVAHWCDITVDDALGCLARTARHDECDAAFDGVIAPAGV